jgi:cyclopropane-fatty-acyl-phospholipid synthase
MTFGRPHALHRLPHPQASPGPSLAADHLFLQLLTRALRPVPVRLVLWDGTSRSASTSPPIASVFLRDRLPLWQVLWHPDLYFGEAYMDGRLEIDGDLVGLLTAIARTAGHRASRRILRPGHGSGGTRAKATRNVHRHYDLGNDFYRSWLDEQLVYTCAYFVQPDVPLERAQRDKLEYVARKLALRPGERVFEAGCGWGALALHLAMAHGVSVRAWNVSTEQLAWARRRAHEAGLDGRVEFIEGDYRTMNGACDAFVSVGMLEHVGKDHYGALGRIIDRTLHPVHGRGLLHFIGRDVPTPMSGWIARYIFPGAYIPALSEALSGVLERGRFAVMDVENLRLHYALTLAHWLDRFERVAPATAREKGDRFVRMWRLYLAEAQAGFRGGALQLFQVVFARPGSDVVPRTRAALYGGTPAP